MDPNILTEDRIAPSFSPSAATTIVAEGRIANCFQVIERSMGSDC